MGASFEEGQAGVGGCAVGRLGVVEEGNGSGPYWEGEVIHAGELLKKRVAVGSVKVEK